MVGILRRIRRSLFWRTIAVGFLIAISTTAFGATPITYQVNFNSTWSATTFPTAYPPTAHYSSLIGGAHNSSVGFWAPGGLASPGIEQMAELGDPAMLRAEVQAAIAAGKASRVIADMGTRSPGSVTTTFDVSADFPLVTLVTMVAPSPDWFVGVHDLDLRQGGGWVSKLVVDLAAYDAGTDNGLNFSSGDIEATPHQPIALLGAPFPTTGPILATFTFTHLTPIPEPSAGDYNGDGIVDAADYTVWRDSENDLGPGLPADGNGDQEVNAPDYTIWANNYGAPGSPAAVGVPEPSALLLVAIAVGALLRRPSAALRRREP